jgi:DNA mismatch endonuclease (patch repair protein)
MASSVSERMARVRNKGTAPELDVRRLLSRESVRYRLHRRDLPGTPDVYVPRLRLAIFVQGCFWHGHECRRGSRPKTNADFWNAKISQNITRDRRTRTQLSALGIDSLDLWTCRRAEFAIHCAIVGRRYRETYDDAAASA